MTKADFDALPQQSKVALVSVVKGLQARLGAGKEWSPYDEVRKN
jgi:hypothetical protein